MRVDSPAGSESEDEVGIDGEAGTTGEVGIDGEASTVGEVGTATLVLLHAIIDRISTVNAMNRALVFVGASVGGSLVLYIGGL
jgi:hypothetical protein